jgi:MFS family permease
VEDSSVKLFWPSVALAFVAAAHGAILALRLPPRLIFNDEVQFGRMVFSLAAFAIVQALALPVWGALSDRFGRKEMIVYSLGATLFTVAASLYASILGLQLSSRFIFAVLGGSTMAGLPLAAAYCFRLIKQGPRHHILAPIVGAFFAGAGLMMLLRLVTFSLAVRGIPIVVSTIVLLVTVTSLVLATFLLPWASPTSVSFTGPDSLQSLWHGFRESNRGSCARWWKAYLALAGAAAGLAMTSLPGFSLNHQVFTAHGALLVVCLVCASVASLVTVYVLERGHVGERSATLAAAAFLLAGLLPLYAIPDRMAGLLAAAVLCGSGLGAATMLGILYFATRAKQRSAGAEFGAVSAIWFGASLAGVWLVLMTFKSDPQTSLHVAMSCALLALVAGFVATRKPL